MILNERNYFLEQTSFGFGPNLYKFCKWQQVGLTFRFYIRIRPQTEDKISDSIKELAKNETRPNLEKFSLVGNSLSFKLQAFSSNLLRSRTRLLEVIICILCILLDRFLSKLKSKSIL